MDEEHEVREALSFTAHTGAGTKLAETPHYRSKRGTVASMNMSLHRLPSTVFYAACMHCAWMLSRLDDGWRRSQLLHRTRDSMITR